MHAENHRFFWRKPRKFEYNLYNKEEYEWWNGWDRRILYYRTDLIKQSINSLSYLFNFETNCWKICLLNLKKHRPMFISQTSLEYIFFKLFILCTIVSRVFFLYKMFLNMQVILCVRTEVCTKLIWKSFEKLSTTSDGMPDFKHIWMMYAPN